MQSLAFFLVSLFAQEPRRPNDVASLMFFPTFLFIDTFSHSMWSGAILRALAACIAAHDPDPAVHGDDGQGTPSPVFLLHVRYDWRFPTVARCSHVR